MLSLIKCVSLALLVTSLALNAISPASASAPFAPAAACKLLNVLLVPGQGSWPQNQRYRQRQQTRNYNNNNNNDPTNELVLLYTNEERRRAGLPALAYNAELSKAAQRHAKDMALQGYFSHTGSDGSSLGDRVKQSTNYRYVNVAENLYWRSPDNNPALVVQGWMQSPGHRVNILNGEFTEMGIAYVSTSSNHHHREDDETPPQHYYVQVFGRPLETPLVQGKDETRRTLLDLTNQVRHKARLPPLHISDQLSVVAQQHAETLARSRTGKGLDGEVPFAALKGFYYRMAANVAMREPFNDPHAAMKSWLESDNARVLMDAEFSETGLGYATHDEQHYYVQLFGTPAGVDDDYGYRHHHHDWDRDNNYRHHPTGVGRRHRRNLLGEARPRRPF